MSIKDPKNFAPVPEGEASHFRADKTEDLKGGPDGALEKLGMYLSDLTSGVSTPGSTAFVPASPNAYSVSTTQTLSSPYGNGTTRADIPMGGADSTQDLFTSATDIPASAGNEGAATAFDDLKRGSYMTPPDGSGDPDLFNKNEGTAGHDLLRSVVSQREPFEPGVGDTSGQKTWEVPSDAPPIQQRISAILGYNRFTPLPGSSPHIEGGEFTNAGAAASQDKLGVYDSGSTLTSTYDQHLMTLLSLMRATGHRTNGAYPTGAAARQAVVTAASKVQAGAKKVNTRKLRVKNSHDAPSSVEIDDAELLIDDITGDPLGDQMSVGALNSPWEPFEAFGAGKMMLVTVRAFTRLLVEGAAFTAILSLIEGAADSSPPSNPSGMKYGQHITHTGAAAVQKRIVMQMGVPEMKYPLWKCYVMGIQRFFGMPDAAIPSGLDVAAAIGIEALLTALGAWITSLAAAIVANPAAAFDTFFNIMFSPGYYASITRSMNQDLSSLLDDISSLGANPADNPASAAIRMMFGFNRYTSFRFIISLSTMGNAAMQARKRDFPSGGGQAQLRSTMPDNGMSRVGKSRIRRDTPLQAIRHRSAPALFLVPKKQATAYSIFHNQLIAGDLHAAMEMVGDHGNIPAPGDPFQGQRRRGTPNLDSEMNHPYTYNSHGGGARLPLGLVKEMENELEMEYMPFYFHDLRTNEVISFHAFLEDVKDSYSVAYQSTKGYGRVDNVHIYKDTDRSVSVSWVMFATSPEDFDSLWFSVNKMITMLYPQWSKGKRVRAGDHKFVQPFSQIPTASPVIRMRVGDLIRSNYSRYNLAKLFGITEAVQASPAGSGGTPTGAFADADFDISSASADAAAAAAATGPSPTPTESEAAAWAAFQARVAVEPTSEGDITHGWLEGDLCYLKANSSQGYTTWDEGEEPWSWPPPDASHVEFTPFRSRTYTEGQTVSQGRVLKRFWLTDGGDGMNPEGAGGSPRTTEYLFAFDERDNPVDPYGPVSAKGHWHRYIVTGGDLIPIRGPIPEPPEPPEGSVTFEQQVTNMHDFFSPNNNAIVSSFEEGMGRGLAGVITSFDMDWKDFQWETGRLGSRAPQGLKISISYSPIHDIVPGLDHTGFPRVMNYPVGRIAGRLNTDRYDWGRIEQPIGSTETDPTDPIRDRFNEQINETFADSGSPGVPVETDE